MAEIKIEALVLTASASVISKGRRVQSVGFIAHSTATASGKSVLTVKGAANVGATASIPPVASRLIKYAKDAMTSSTSATATLAVYRSVRAVLASDSTLAAFSYDRDVHAEMPTYLPPQYNDLLDVQTMINAEASEVIRLQAKLAEMLDQFYVNSATYGLDRWEREAAIVPIDARSSGSRRHYINAKLRGYGTITDVQLKSIVDAFYFAEVADYPRESIVKIKLLGKRGIPKNLEDIEVAVTDVIPAHLAHEYEYTYATWSELETAETTWADVEGTTMKAFEEAFYVEPPFPYET